MVWATYQRGARDIGGEDVSGGFECQSDCDCAGACADVDDNIARLDASDGRFDQVLGFRARDQDVRRHAEIAAVKFLAAGDVLGRLALHPLVQVAAVVDPGDLAQFFVGMRVKIAAVALQGVGQQNFGGEARRGDGFVFQELGALEESGQDGHESQGVHTSVNAARKSACATSDARRLRLALSTFRSDSSW